MHKSPYSLLTVGCTPSKPALLDEATRRYWHGMNVILTMNAGNVSLETFVKVNMDVST